MSELNPEATSDATIKRLIVEELYWDNRLDVSKIHVEVNNGVVTLTGHVPTLTDKYSAEADARMIRNVVTVENQLEITRPVIVPDQELKSNINTILTWAPDVDNSDIDVAVLAGNVTLRGSIPKYWDKLQAHLLTRSITGVLGIVDELAVAPTHQISDRDISHDLMRALERRLAEDLSLIQVTVNNGAVTLRGSIKDQATLSKVLHATELTRGVSSIHNHLKIQHSQA